MSWFDLIILPENFIWAWRKVRRAYRTTDALYDYAELAGFELCLDQQLESIRNDFIRGRYRLDPIKLVPQPKKPDKNGNPRLRQYFQLSVRDQVAWTAFVNAIGPELDNAMPAWSYGNRLYRAAWYEGEPAEKPSKLNVGPYRHAAGYLYRHFKHSWPLYRRHLSLTSRKMATGTVDESELDLGERLAYGQIEGLQYLAHNYWPAAKGDHLHTASLDLKQFYPSLSVDLVRRGIALLPGFEQDADAQALLSALLTFKVDASGLSPEMQQVVDPRVVGKDFRAIPTGLFVGGFLANAAMLPVDHAVDLALDKQRTIAHFRFVDDHEFLAYDADELIAWIKQYNDILMDIVPGVHIERDKYQPKSLKYIIHADNGDQPEASAVDALRHSFSAETKIDGRKPTELMTRTLAQVSMLAATDFDLLTDAGRSQRLEQLEWLLLANIPDHEIRADTRAAFAASRIAHLTPSMFKPDDTLLSTSRTLHLLVAKKVPGEGDAAEISRLQQSMLELSTKEQKQWHGVLRRHFGLLLEAFTAHPEKVRLFIKLLEYCRATGFDGFPAISRWMREHASDGSKMLKCYLGAMAIHVVSRNISTACRDVGQNDLLHRERAAARDFLLHIIACDWNQFVPFNDPSDHPLESFQRDALNALAAASMLGALDLRAIDFQLSEKLDSFGASIPLGSLDQALGSLAEASGRPLGAWAQWTMAVRPSNNHFAPEYWQDLADLFDPTSDQDWNSMRRYPKSLPESAWNELKGKRLAQLSADDAGWLYDAARGNPQQYSTLPPAQALVKRTNRAMEGKAKHITLIEWSEFIHGLKNNDPRRSEWTALEIIKQIVASLSDIESSNIDLLDKLHPANIFLPEIWRQLPESALIAGQVSWEGWRSVAANNKLVIARFGLADFRYSEVIKSDTVSWPRRMRGLGQLLWGLLRQSFSLPAVWNIRGQERSLVDVVSSELERLPISSCTLSVLRACLMPRNRETAVMAQFPALFGKSGTVADDTEFDWPIESPGALDSILTRSQQVLLLSQMTILEHEPRQLIPVHLQQIGSLGAFEAMFEEPEA